MNHKTKRRRIRTRNRNTKRYTNTLIKKRLMKGG